MTLPDGNEMADTDTTGYAPEGYVRHRSRRFLVVVAMALLMLWQPPSIALTLHYYPERESALRSCDEAANRGDKPVADRCFAALLDDDSALVRAEAARALGDVKTANRYFREASSDAAEPLDLAIVSARWGELYLSTHQYSCLLYTSPSPRDS